MTTQGSRLKKIRQALNISQGEFGEIFGISKQFVSLIENDKTYLNNDKLVKLLLDYNVNLNYLLGGIGEMFNANAKQFEQEHEVFTQIVHDLINKELEARGL